MPAIWEAPNGDIYEVERRWNGIRYEFATTCKSKNAVRRLPPSPDMEIAKSRCENDYQVRQYAEAGKQPK